MPTITTLMHAYVYLHSCVRGHRYAVERGREGTCLPPLQAVGKQTCTPSCCRPTMSVRICPSVCGSSTRSSARCACLCLPLLCDDDDAVCVSVPTPTCMYMCVFLCVWAHVYACVCVWRLHVCMGRHNTHVHAQMCMYGHVCVCVCVRVCDCHRVCVCPWDGNCSRTVTRPPTR